MNWKRLAITCLILLAACAVGAAISVAAAVGVFLIGKMGVMWVMIGIFVFIIAWSLAGEWL